MNAVFPTRFADAVRSEFSYLRSYNFTEIEATDRKVIYSRQDWTISIYFVPFEFEVGLSIAHLGLRFQINSFIEAMDPDEFAQTRVLVAENDDELRTALEVLSSRLQKFGAKALSGDSTVMDFVARALEAADARRT